MSSRERKLPPIRRRQVNVLSASDRERIETQIRQNDREISGNMEELKGLSPKSRKAFQEMSDGADLKARNARLRRALEAGSRGPVTGAERSRMEQRSKELAGYLSKQMVPRTATELRPGNVAFNRAKNMMIKNELANPEFQSVAQEWKNIQRTLHPADPDASNLETIRPETA